MKETDLYRLIKRGLPQVHWQRIETGRTGSGIPDLNGCYSGVEAWAELKVHPSKLSSLQRNWLNARAKAGGNVWVVIGYPKLMGMIEFLRPEPLPGGLRLAMAVQKPYDWSLVLMTMFDCGAMTDKAATANLEKSHGLKFIERGTE